MHQSHKQGKLFASSVSLPVTYAIETGICRKQIHNLCIIMFPAALLK